MAEATSPINIARNNGSPSSFILPSRPAACGIRRIVVYAPTPIKAACPKLINPVHPKWILSPIAEIAYIPANAIKFINILVGPSSFNKYIEPIENTIKDKPIKFLLKSVMIFFLLFQIFPGA